MEKSWEWPFGPTFLVQSIIIIDCDNYYYNSYLIERSVISYRSDRFCCDVGICCLTS